MSVFNQYVLPQTPHRVGGISGVIDIRLSRGLFDWNLIDTHPDQVMTLDSGTRIVNSFTSRKMAFADVDGDLTADARNLVLEDALDYTGVSNGVTTTANLRSAQQSLLWQIFESDPTVPVFQIWFTFMPTPKNGQYSAGASYTIGQTVAFRGKPYKCIASTTGNSPVDTSTGLVNTTWWQVNYSIYFAGDVDKLNIQKTPIAVHKYGTSAHLQWDIWTLSLSPMVNRAKLGTIGMLLGTTTPLFGRGAGAPTSVPFTQSDMVQFSAASPGNNSGGTVGFTTTTRPFYTAITSRDVRNGGVGYLSPYDYVVRTYTDWQGADLLGYMGNGFDSWADPLFDSTWPHFMWGMKVSTPLAKIANALNFGFNPSTDFTSAFTFKGQTWNNTNKSYDLHAVSLDNLAVCYNAVFGVSPINSGSSLWTNPLAFTPETTFADFYKAWAYQFGCYIWHDINQVTGQVNIQLLSRRTSFGAIPSNWKMKKGFPKREASIIAKDYVTIKNKEADGELRCPAIDSSTAQGIEIPLPLRVRPMGAIGLIGDNLTQKVFTDKYQIINSKWAPNNQGPACEIIDHANTPPLRSDGWMCGAFLYEIKTSTTNDRFPPEWVGRSSFNSNTTDNWDGFVAVAVCTENSTITDGDSNTPNTLAGSRADTYNAPAQLLARELLDSKAPYTIEFKGCSDGAGDLTGVRPGLEYSWAPPGGTMTTFRVIEIDIDELTDSTKVKVIPKPTYSTLADLSTLFINPNSGSSSGSQGSPTQAPPSSVPSPHSVLDNPIGAGQNNIVSGAIDTVNLRRTRTSGQTADFDQWWDESSNLLGKVDKNGNITFKAATFNGAVVVNSTLSMASHQINNVTDPSVAQDAATKNYVDTQVGTVTGFLELSPGTTQTVQGTGGAGKTVFKANASQSVNMIEIQQSTGAVAAFFDALGELQLNTAFVVNVSSGAFAQFNVGAANKFDFDSSGTLFITNTAAGQKSIVLYNSTSEVGWFKQTGDGFLSGNFSCGSFTTSGSLDGNGSIKVAQHSKTSAYTATTTDGIIFANASSGAFTITLPSASSMNGRMLYIKRMNSGANNVTISPPSGTIDGAATKALTAQYQGMWITSDGSNFFIIGN